MSRCRFAVRLCMTATSLACAPTILPIPSFAASSMCTHGGAAASSICLKCPYTPLVAQVSRYLRMYPAVRFGCRPSELPQR